MKANKYITRGVRAGKNAAIKAVNFVITHAEIEMIIYDALEHNYIITQFPEHFPDHLNNIDKIKITKKGIIKHLEYCLWNEGIKFFEDFDSRYENANMSAVTEVCKKLFPDFYNK